MQSLLLAITAVLLAIPGIARTNDSLPFTTLAIGNQSGIRTQMKVVVRAPAEWEALWEKHTAGLRRPPATPAIDFTREMIIGIFAGEVPSPTRVTVVKIVQQGNYLVVMFRVGDLQPGPVEVDAKIITPFQILRIRRFTLPVVFIQVKNPVIY